MENLEPVKLPNVPRTFTIASRVNEFLTSLVKYSQIFTLKCCALLPHPSSEVADSVFSVSIISNVITFGCLDRPLVNGATWTSTTRPSSETAVPGRKSLDIGEYSWYFRGQTRRIASTVSTPSVSNAFKVFSSNSYEDPAPNASLIGVSFHASIS